jgi:hypothetical protein
MQNLTALFLLNRFFYFALKLLYTAVWDKNTVERLNLKFCLGVKSFSFTY